MPDGAITWQYAEGGEVDDFADLPVDATGNLDNSGLIWMLVPKAEAKNTVTTQFVEEVAKAAGLRVLSSSHVSAQRLGICLQSCGSDRQRIWGLLAGRVSRKRLGVIELENCYKPVEELRVGSIYKTRKL